MIEEENEKDGREGERMLFDEDRGFRKGWFLREEGMQALNVPLFMKQKHKCESSTSVTLFKKVAFIGKIA